MLCKVRTCYPNSLKRSHNCFILNISALFCLMKDMCFMKKFHLIPQEVLNPSLYWNICTVLVTCTEIGVKIRAIWGHVHPGMTSDIISLFCVTRVSPHQIFNRYFVVIHNFSSIIHNNVCVVYLIVLLTIQSNFLKILKDTNWISPTTSSALGSNSSQSDHLIHNDLGLIDTQTGCRNPEMR